MSSPSPDINDEVDYRLFMLYAKNGWVVAILKTYTVLPLHEIRKLMLDQGSCSIQHSETAQPSNNPGGWELKEGRSIDP